MKDERTNLMGRLISHVREYFSRQEQTDGDYRRMYASCFEGSDEEVRTKLAHWDEVHRMTRQSDSYTRQGGLF